MHQSLTLINLFRHCQWIICEWIKIKATTASMLNCVLGVLALSSTRLLLALIRIWHACPASAGLGVGGWCIDIQSAGEGSRPRCEKWNLRFSADDKA